MTSFETTPEKRQQLSKDGFSLLPGASPFDLLTRWQRIAKRLEMEALDAHGRVALSSVHFEGATGFASANAGSIESTRWRSMDQRQVGLLLPGRFIQVITG